MGVGASVSEVVVSSDVSVVGRGSGVGVGAAEVSDSDAVVMTGSVAAGFPGLESTKAYKMPPMTSTAATAPMIIPATGDFFFFSVRTGETGVIPGTFFSAVHLLRPEVSHLRHHRFLLHQRYKELR